jgi:hypothetical protein
MGVFVNRVSKQSIFGGNTPDYNPVDWVVYSKAVDAGDISALQALITAGVPNRYFKIMPDDSVVEMSAPEKLVVDNSLIHVGIVSDQPLDFDGVPVAPPLGKHTLTISLLNQADAPFSGAATLRIIPVACVTAPGTGVISVVAGVATVDAGPFPTAAWRGDAKISIEDPAGIILAAELAIRFR